jgi:hypothetical protein
MIRLFQKTFLLALAIVGAGNGASGFSLLGPFDTWQTTAIGYNSPGTFAFADIGGPMNRGEEYRWNERTITYGFDKSFVDYFGQKGVTEVNKAVAILNNLPPFSSMSASLNEFPTDSKRINYQAYAVYLLDLKSQALQLLVEQMGLASPERYVWCLRSRIVQPSGTATNYTVIMRNFDPVNLFPSKYVNNVLYTYQVVEFPAPNSFSDAIEKAVDPFASFTSVASGNVIAEDPFGSLLLSALVYGEFYTGLTRDDIGGLRYLYSARGPYAQVNEENLIPGTVGASSAGSSPWSSAGAAGASNAVVNLAPRPGVDKIVFRQVSAPFGIFNGVLITNTYTGTYYDVRGVLLRQNVQRVSLVGPDILFKAGDLGVGSPSGVPFERARTFTTVNNSDLNTSGTLLAGPGEILPTVSITFGNIGPFIINQFPNFMTEASPASEGWVWGSFDGTTNVPFVYPAGPNGKGTSIQVLQQQVLNQ